MRMRNVVQEMLDWFLEPGGPRSCNRALSEVVDCGCTACSVVQELSLLAKEVLEEE